MTSKKDAIVTPVVTRDQYFHFQVICMRGQNPSRPRTKKSAIRPGGMPALNLTSCIDVVFLLLVFFIVTASFTDGEGVLASQTTNTGQNEIPADPQPPVIPLKIEVTSVGTSGCRLEIRNHPVAPTSFSQLSKLLVDMQYNSSASQALGRRDGPFAVDTPVFIMANGRVRWQHVVNAFNAVVSAGYKNVRLGSPDYVMGSSDG